MRIYMDVCCYNRPFDDSKQDRILIETDAILAILDKCSEGKWTLIGSKAIDIEIDKMNDDNRHNKVKCLSSACSEKTDISDSSLKRVVELQTVGIKFFDGLHIALAEESNADVFLTTDDKLIHLSKKVSLRTQVYNPVNWIMEVLNNE
jgi:hypothetical protein